MKRYFIYIPACLQFMATFLLLSVVCVSSKELPPGDLAKQWWWLARTGLPYAAFIGISFLFYPKDTKINRPGYAHTVAWAFICLGGWEALLGLCQTSGLSYSNHSLFTLTGTFFNPGPYSGYLAMVFPICLNEYFRLKKMSADSLWAKTGYYTALTVLLLIVCVLPAGMSRSAWLAAGVSGLFVAWRRNDWGKALKRIWSVNKRKVILRCISGGFCLLMGLAFIFYLKKDSANGRLFMWKISLHAISGSPLTGYGVNGFPNAYGMAQEAYFATGEYAEWEERVAGNPEYAFNEYLQVAIEGGVPALLFCLIVVALCLWRGIRLKRTGVCGGILSLAVFSFSSYPLQLPVFMVSLLVLLFACISGTKRIWLRAFSLGVVLWSLYLWKTDDYDESREWTRVRMLYNTGAYASAKKEYDSLYSTLKNRAEFMFEYGRCLHKLGEYDASNQLLQMASLLTCDPMVFNIMAKNHQMAGRYEEAERYLHRSVNRLPGRIYPYYLLAKLYADPCFFQPDKFEFAARMVIEKEPKVQSTAIREMREEIRSIANRIRAANF
jgi:O-antigen ligase